MTCRRAHLLSADKEDAFVPVTGAPRIAAFTWQFVPANFADMLAESAEPETAEPMKRVTVVQSGTNGGPPTFLRVFAEPEYAVVLGSTTEPIFCAPCS